MNHVVVQNPATGEEVARFPEIGADELRAVIARARTAQPGWAALPLSVRKRHVGRMRDWLVEHVDEAAATISECSGKTPLEAMSFDVTPAVFSNGWYCKHAAAHLRVRRLRSGTLLLPNKYSRLYRKPHGVIGIISPWNYPLGIPMHEIVPALLAGNTVVFKTAPETVPVGKLIERMCQASLPADVFHHIVVDGPLCGEVMLDDGGVDKLFFTGSVRVGKLLAERAAKRLVPVSLELGGKDAMIVLDDANIERAAHGAIWGGMQNAGQSCAGVERVYVQRAVFDEFLARVKERVEALRVRGPLREDSDMGVLTSDRQVQTVRAHLAEALEHGAKVHAQAKAEFDSERIIPPTVLIDVTHDMRVMREETFGPVIGVMPFETEDEAVRLANDSPYALTASVWTRSAKRGERLARRIEAGAVTINDHLMSHGMTETPWGGPKNSGLGRGHGRFAFEEVTQPQAVVHDRLGFTPRALWWYPYSRDAYLAMRGAVRFRFGRGLATRLAGLLHYFRGATRIFRRP